MTSSWSNNDVVTAIGSLVVLPRGGRPFYFDEGFFT
jgi:hypothetical protein